MQFSERSGAAREPNLVAETVERMRVQGRPVLDLTESNPTHAGIAYAREEILSSLSNERALIYDPEPFGLPSARRAVAEMWKRRGVAVEPEQVVLTASTSEAYAFMFKLLCNPGDEILVPRPSYPLLEHLASFEAVNIVPYDLSYNGAWHLDFTSLERGRSERSRGIVVVNPNNPTGSYLKQHELERLASLGLPLVSDEVFASYALRDETDRVATALATRQTVVAALGGLSKLAGLPQLKLAWITLGGPDQDVAEALGRLELIADAYLSPGIPVQLALPKLLESRGVAEEAIAARIASNLERLRGLLEGSAATLLDVEGGWYAVIRLPETRFEEQWVLGLLEEDGVLVHPGWYYDFMDEPFVVLSLLTPESTFALGAARLVTRVTQWSESHKASAEPAAASQTESGQSE